MAVITEAGTPVGIEGPDFEAPQVAFISATREEHSEFNSDMVELLRALGYNCLRLSYPEIEEQLDNLRKCKVVFIGGVPATIEESNKLYQADTEGSDHIYKAEVAEEIASYLEPLMQLQEEEDLFVVGICAGHQAIGSFFRLEVRRWKGMEGEEVEVDNYEVEIEDGATELAIKEGHENSSLFEGLEESIIVNNSHWAWLGEIPKNSQVECMASSIIKDMVSTGCKYAIIKIKDRDIYGFQFHPETSGAVGKRIIFNILKMAGLEPKLKSEKQPIEV